MDLAVVGEQVKHPRLVLMRPHLALQNLSHILVRIVLIPIVDYAHGHFGFILQLQTDEAGQLVDIIDDRGLFASDYLLIDFVGTAQVVEETHLVGRECHLLATEVLGKPGRLEVGHTLVDSLLPTGDGNVVHLVQFHALVVDQFVG